MEQWTKLLNKQVKVIYDDGQQFPKKKEGKLLEVTSTHLFLQINGLSQALLLSKILRVEEVPE